SQNEPFARSALGSGPAAVEPRPTKRSPAQLQQPARALPRFDVRVRSARQARGPEIRAMKRCRGLARPLVLALFAWLVVLFRHGICLAQPQAPREVEVVLVGVLGDDPVFASRVTSWFAPERFHVSVRRAPFLEPKQVLSPSSDAYVH